MVRRIASLLFLAAGLTAQTPFFAVKDLKPGMKGIGKTVFTGGRIEDFQVEILGVLENTGPKQSLVLARLSGGPLDRMGVMQGMSGSPVYINGRLLGAVAMAFPFSKEPIAAIRPMDEMVRVSAAPAAPARRASINLGDTDLTRAFLPRGSALTGEARMVDVATPVSFGGFTNATLEHFAPQLRALGLEPQQGISSGGRTTRRMGPASALQPGAMISVQLMSGDMSIAADGSVTWIDGGRVYAFGHRFLSMGATALPFARSEVITLLPSLNSSFKISTPRELMGTISQDRDTAIYGELGRRTPLAPLSIAVSRGGKRVETYRMQMVGDRYLAPLLVQMAVFSSINATERTLGASSFRVKGEIELGGSDSPIRLNNMYAAENNSALLVSLSTAVPLAYVLQSGFSALELRRVALEIESFDERKELQIDQVFAGRPTVRPGEKVELTTVLAGEDGKDETRKVEYTVPPGAPPGPLFFTVADATTTNMTEFRQMIGVPPKSVDQVISLVNSLRANTGAYVRVWRAEPAYQLEGADLPDPPPSAALILASPQAAGTITQTRNSKLAELQIGAGDVVITGSKTIHVEVKP